MTSAKLHNLKRRRGWAHLRSAVQRSWLSKTYVVSIPVVIVSAISLVIMPSELPHRTTREHCDSGDEQKEAE